MKPTLTYVSLFSGIEACSVAMSRITDVNWQPVFFSEIDPFPCAVLAHHFPDVPNLGDVTQIKVNKEKTEITNGRTTIPFPGVGIDLLAGGSPCQDCSVAGKRAGMAEGSGTRSALAFEYARLVEELRPRIILWENVQGVLSSNEGCDFLAFQDSLVERGYSLAWRVLDAQFTTSLDFPRAIPQRRKRVWLVGCIGADESVPAEILFERSGMLGDTPPRREAGKGSSSPVGYRVGGDDRVVGAPDESCGTIGGGGVEDVSEVLTARAWKGIGARNGQICGPFTATVAGGDVCPTLDASYPGHLNHQDLGKFPICIGKEAYNMGDAAQGSMNISEDDSAQTVRADTHPSAVAIATFENHAQDSRVRPIDVAPTQGASNANSVGVSGNNPLVVFAKASHARNKQGDGERFEESDVAGTRNTFDIGETRTQEFVCSASVGFMIGPSSKTGSIGAQVEQSPTLDTQCAKGVAIGYIVRRLTPTEAERLMGFPDGWTKIPFRGKTADECPDSPRYRGLGNSWATNCAEWILRRIVAADRLGLIPYDDFNLGHGASSRGISPGAGLITPNSASLPPVPFQPTNTNNNVPTNEM